MKGILKTMKVSLNCLKDYIDITGGKEALSREDIHSFAEKLTMTGTKVEGYEVPGSDIKNVVVGKLLTVTPHPDSDHLLVCGVDIGGETTIQVVTGANNISPGDFVPVCLDGGKLPGGKTIKAGSLRGVASEGMLCSLSELNLTLHDFPYADEDGIFVLGDEFSPKPGEDITKALMIDDVVVDFELTFNRPDCTAFLGIAREAASALGVEFRYSEPTCGGEKKTDSAENYIRVKIENPELCPRYTARVVKNVKVGMSPLWLRARLKSLGIRPINNIVDITNYVMLEYGQPMHAFDHSFIKSGEIVVRTAREGESITTLDGIKRSLDQKMLCIADGQTPIAVAGVMGGENSEISQATKTVVFESANFNRESVRFTSRELGLRTDSSKRFEKGLPPYNTFPAVNRACELVKELGCGEVVSGVVDVCHADLKGVKLPFEPERVNSLLGTDIKRDEMISLLEKVEITESDGFLRTPPYRLDISGTADIASSADIAEEVMRLYGIENITPTSFKANAKEGKRPKENVFINRLAALCASLGYNEIYSYSFMSPLMFDKIRLAKDDGKRNAVKILNPLGDETSAMRTTLLPSVLSSLSFNANRRAAEAKLFEAASVYKKDGDTTLEEREFCLGFYGGGGFFDLKGEIAALCRALNIKNYGFARCDGNPSYHPGRAAYLTSGGGVIGVFGQVHPSAAKEFGLEGDVYAAELSAAKLFEKSEEQPQYTPIPIYPSVERDLALVTESSAEAGEVVELIKRFGGKTLIDAFPFDVYHGAGLGEGKKSMAFRLTFRHSERTLSDDEVESAVAKILRRLADEAGIKLRT